MSAVTLVTGVTGMVGSRVAKDLLAAGHQVFGLARQALGTFSPGTDCPWTGIDCDLRSSAQVLGVLRQIQPDLIIHAAAAQGGATAAAPVEELWATNVAGTLHLLEGVRQATPQARVVVVGSGASYGRGETPRCRWTEAAPLRPATPYAASKAAADLAAQAYAAAFGMDVVVARLFNVLGPSRNSDSAPAWFARQIAEIEAGLREPRLTCGDLQAVRDYLDYRDVAAALCRLGTAQNLRRVYNVCSGRGIRLGYLLRCLLRHGGLGRRCSSRLPTAPSMSDRLVGNPARLVRETGWQPVVDLEQATADLLQFWRDRVGTVQQTQPK